MAGAPRFTSARSLGDSSRRDSAMTGTSSVPSGKSMGGSTRRPGIAVRRGSCSPGAGGICRGRSRYGGTMASSLLSADGTSDRGYWSDTL